MTSLRLHQFLPVSCCNGPGERAVLWLQGCLLACPGCFNPLTHDPGGGFVQAIRALAGMLNSLPVRGVTLSGGEPLLQAGPLLALLDLLAPEMDVLLFSGYRPDEIQKNEEQRALLRRVDAALLGRYSKRLAHPYYGKFLLTRTGRISPEELTPALTSEIVIGTTGNAVVTGFPGV